jgi:hypothetical protein
MKRSVAADAAAAGSGVGVGASFGIAVINDSAEATLKRSVTAANVLVDAKSVSRLTMTIKASAVGATPPTSTSTGDAASGKPPEDYDKMKDDGWPLDDNGDDMRSLFNEGEADQMADKNTQAAADLAAGANTTTSTPVR